MKTYNYIALNARGEQVEGSVSAESEAHAIQDLRVKGYYPTRISLEGLSPAKPRQDRQMVTITLPRVGFRDLFFFILGTVMSAVVFIYSEL